MPGLRSGCAERLPYSLSRWTDLPAAKWSWFRQQLERGSMTAMDPKEGFPSRWSLDPVDTLGMIFWTRNSLNLVRDEHLLRPYRKVIHFTLTGWSEVENKAPGLEEGLDILRSTVECFGADNVTWRFSPIPIVDDVESRFERIARGVMEMGLDKVYVSFLQPNDLLNESRSTAERGALLARLAERTSLPILLCNEDKSTPSGLRGVCEDGRRFIAAPDVEGCGCALAVDPFTQNEACIYGCAYCYAANRGTSTKKRNTTKLPLYREPR